MDDTLPDLGTMSAKDIGALEAKLEGYLVLVRQERERRAKAAEKRMAAALAQDADYQHRLREMERFRGLTREERERELDKPDGPGIIFKDGTAFWF